MFDKPNKSNFFLLHVIVSLDSSSNYVFFFGFIKLSRRFSLIYCCYIIFVLH